MEINYKFDKVEEEIKYVKANQKEIDNNKKLQSKKKDDEMGKEGNGLYSCLVQKIINYKSI